MKKGFTLVELLTVIGILAVMLAIAVPVVSNIQDKSELSADAVFAEEIETAVYDWMSLDYSSENFQRSNLFTSRYSGSVRELYINGYAEQTYSYYYAGTGQLPGVEEAREAAIRHSVITALKSVSSIKIVVRDGEQFIESPKAGAQYGYKYYYKIGRVNTERLDSTESALGNDEVYQYYVWLDRTGGVVGGTTTPKQSKDTNSFYVARETLAGFEFGFGARDANKVMTIIEMDGKQSYTVYGETKTPRIFGKGTYTLRFYYNGSLFKTITAEITTTEMEYINAA